MEVLDSIQSKLNQIREYIKSRSAEENCQCNGCQMRSQGLLDSDCRRICDPPCSGCLSLARDGWPCPGLHDDGTHAPGCEPAVIAKGPSPVRYGSWED